MRYVADFGLLSPVDRHRLADLTRQFAERWSWEPAKGFDLTPAMVAAIAGNAALLTLGLDEHALDNVRAVIVHRGTVRTSGPRSGPVDGVVSDEPEYLAGEAHQHRGPVLLSWSAVHRKTRRYNNGYNVVLHEFAHKLDMADGMIDGTPDLGDAHLRERWIRVCTAEYESVQRGLADHVLRPYAGSDVGEFFAVATESFFNQPVRLREHHRHLYDVFADFYGQDPAGRRHALAHR